MSNEDKKSKIPAILLGVAIALAIIAFMAKSLPCIPIPVPAGQPAPDPAKVEVKKAELPPVQPVDPTTGGLTVDKPDLGLVSPPLAK